MTGLLDKTYSFRQVKLIRSSIFFILALLAAISSYVYYIYDIKYPFYVTAVYFFIILGCAYIYNFHNLFFWGRYLAFLFTCAMALILSYLEGYDAQVIHYFLPLVMIIQILVSKKNNYRSQSILFYFTWTAFIVATLTVTRDKGVVLLEKPEAVLVLKIVNLSAVYLLCVIYSVFGLLQERLYIGKLTRGKLAAIELKNKRTAMLSSLGHEIRTQATSINAASKMLMETDLSSSQKPMVEVLEYSTNQMFYLIDDILDLRKLEGGMFILQPEPKNISKIIKDASLPFRDKAAAKDLQLLTIIDGRLDGCRVMADETRLNQVLHNLLSNALKYTLEGSISLTASLLDEDAEDVSVYFEVSDTGIGIKEENINNIFDSFWQVKSDEATIYGGSGLGLTISNSIVNKMDSQLKVDSKINRGSRFYFTLKLRKASFAEVKAPRANAHNGKYNGQQVLIAEDNQTSLLFATKLLQRKNMIVHQANNGLEAVRVLSGNPDISIVLLDLEMPEMNGYIAINELKKINDQAKIIAFTANIPDSDFSQKLYGLGFDDIISKPFNKEILFETIQKHLL